MKRVELVMKVTSLKRMQASARIVSKGLHSLYYPKRMRLRKSESLKFALNTRSFPESSSPNYLGYSHGERTFIALCLLRKTKGRFRISGLRKTLSHELIHSMNLSKNDLVTATAFAKYFEDALKRKPQKISTFPVTAQEASLIEKAFTKHVKRIINQKVGMAKDTVQADKIAYDTEHKPIILRQSFSDIGNSLGEIALMIEEKTKIAGAGAVLITEVSQGKKLKAVMRGILRGQYRERILGWIKENPSIKRGFIRARKLKKRDLI